MNTFSVGDRVRCVRDYHGFPCKLDANETYVVREVEADDDGEQFVYLEGQGNSAFSSVRFDLVEPFVYRNGDYDHYLGELEILTDYFREHVTPRIMEGSVSGIYLPLLLSRPDFVFFVLGRLVLAELVELDEDVDSGVFLNALNVKFDEEQNERFDMLARELEPFVKAAVDFIIDARDEAFMDEVAASGEMAADPRSGLTEAEFEVLVAPHTGALELLMDAFKEKIGPALLSSPERYPIALSHNPVIVAFAVGRIMLDAVVATIGGRPDLLGKIFVHGSSKFSEEEVMSLSGLANEFSDVLKEVLIAYTASAGAEAETRASELGRADYAASVIRNLGGRVFGATVRTRSGEMREFNAKVTGDSFSGEAFDKGLLIVYEINASRREGSPAYRTINLDGVAEIRSGGSTWNLNALYGEV